MDFGRFLRHHVAQFEELNMAIAIRIVAFVVFAGAALVYAIRNYYPEDGNQ